MWRSPGSIRGSAINEHHSAGGGPSAAASRGRCHSVPLRPRQQAHDAIRAGLAALGVLGLHRRFIVAIALAAPAIAPHDPLQSNFRQMTKPPSGLNYFGTDQIGRDTLSRVIYGSRASLTVAVAAVALGTTLGAFWGLACGFFGGRIDTISQRLIEALQSFPDLILAMAIAMALGVGMGTVIVAIAITRIPFGGRVIRAVVLSLKETPFVEAAGLGASNLRLMLRHILPQCIAPYLILATTHLGVAIIIEAALGFLGVGIPPPTPTWGNMLAGSERGVGAAVVAGAFSRCGHYDHRASVQFDGRRNPGHPGPAPARGRMTAGLDDER
jgi:ABC-type dipeptide/oligopeptide/nickel transport system permease subunit